jgi:hypothetical protein
MEGMEQKNEKNNYWYRSVSGSGGWFFPLSKYPSKRKG